jgi:hypothetical protein
MQTEDIAYGLVSCMHVACHAYLLLAGGMYLDDALQQSLPLVFVRALAAA